MNGRVLLVDKPRQWTSFDVVNKIKSVLRYHLGIKKIRVGHAGTLDPLATGLLIICTGRATKEIEQYQGMDKTYTGSFCLGQTTPSYDLETKPENRQPIGHLTHDDLHRAADSFIGVQDQVPPLFSAKKIGGERAYTHARRGMQTSMEPGRVEIKSFEITRIHFPEVGFRVVCSKGTYIRALARDFGEKTGVGAYLSALRRTHIGHFSVSDAWQTDQLEEMLGNARFI